MTETTTNVALTAAEIKFLLEVLKTPGMGFKLDMCRLAADTVELLEEALNAPSPG